jgi:hypothetical protein
VFPLGKQTDAHHYVKEVIKWPVLLKLCICQCKRTHKPPLLSLVKGKGTGKVDPVL